MTQTRPTITLVNGTESEQLLKGQLLELFERYELSKWFYAEQVQIEEGVIPHSHPVLTLSPKTRITDYLSDSESLLAAYVHEQLHWFTMLDSTSMDRRRAIAELRIKYPELPVGYPDGCRSEFSNYVHIIVNYFEYQALRELLDDDRARAVIKNHPFYRAIYSIVLRDYVKLEQLFTGCGLVLPGQPPIDRRFITVKPR